MKNTAPFSLTPLRIWENASISMAGPLDYLQSSLASGQSNLAPQAVRASHGDARAWLYRQKHCTIVALKGLPQAMTGESSKKELT